MHLELKSTVGLSALSNLMKKYNTIYVLYGFIPIPGKVKVFAGIVMVMKKCTCGIPMKYLLKKRQKDQTGPDLKALGERDLTQAGSICFPWNSNCCQMNGFDWNARRP